MIRNIFALALLLSFSMPLCAQSDSAIYRVGNVMDTLARYSQFRGSVAIATHGKIVFRRDISPWDSTGHLQERTPVYRIGSITKMFTATLIMQLAEKRQLSLDDHLVKYYPQIANARLIRIRDLLAHRSGLADYVGGPGFETYYQSRVSKAALLRRIAAFKPESKPNTETSYSSTNFLLLGWILEDIYRMPFAAIVRKFIAEPLQLEHTYAADTLPPSGEVVPSYYWSGGKWKAAPKWGPVAGAAGNMVSSADELIRFTDALVMADKRLLTAAASNQMRTSYGTGPDSVNGFGFGTMSMSEEGRTAWGHGGSIEGYESIVMAFEDDRTTICVIANGERFSINDVFSAVMTGWYGQTDLPSFQPAPAIKLEAEALEKFAGVYEDKVETHLKLRMQVVDGVLTSFVDGQEPVAYVPTDATRFRDADNEIRIRFTTNEKGEAVMKYRQDGFVLELIKQL